MQIRLGGAWRSTVSATAYINGAWREIDSGKAYIGGAWRNIANFTAPKSTPTPSPSPTPSGTLTLSISPSSFSATGIHSTVNSPTLTATPSGGRSPYSYAWSLTFQDGPATINSPSSASTTIASTGASQIKGKCVCRDSTGLSASATFSGSFDQVQIDTGSTA